MRREPDEIILEALKDNPKTSKELLKYCKTQGLEGKTYYRRLKRLIKEGKVKEAKYVLIQEEEANPSEVAEVMRRLEETKNEALLATISEELIRLCDRRRSVHIPNFLSFLESAILEPKFSEANTLSNIIHALYSVLSYERRRHKPDEKIINRIVSNIPKIKTVVEKYHDRDVLGICLLFLSLTESKEAVEIIFNQLRTLSENEFREVESGFELALVGTDSTLYDKHHEMINDKVYELIGSGDHVLRHRGMKLHQRKMRDRR